MNQPFERIYQTDPSQEKDHSREKHHSIEISDEEYVARVRERYGIKCAVIEEPEFKVSKEMEEAGFVYKPPVEEDSMSPTLKEKFKKARELTKETKVIDLRKKDAKSKSKSSKSKSKKNNPKSNSSAMASI